MKKSFNSKCYVLFSITLTLVFFFLLIFFSNSFNSCSISSRSQTLNKRHIAFFLMGTGNYIRLAEQLISSMEKHFCSNTNSINVHYFIFTDASPNWSPLGKLNSNRNFTLIYQRHLDWPFSTLLRFKIILDIYDRFLLNKTYDFLYWLDVDMRFVDDVCEDIFGDLVATRHPEIHSSERAYPYESANRNSRAYIEPTRRFETPYFVGAFFGGTSGEMFRLLMTCYENIQYDYNELNGFIALVHDESHLNKYFLNRPPTLVLSESYCYKEPPGDDLFPYLKKTKPKIYALIKNPDELRQKIS